MKKGEVLAVEAHRRGGKMMVDGEVVLLSSGEVFGAVSSSSSQCGWHGASTVEEQLRRRWGAVAVTVRPDEVEGEGGHGSSSSSAWT